jgi:hypothetical protein
MIEVKEGKLSYRMFNSDQFSEFIFIESESKSGRSGESGSRFFEDSIKKCSIFIPGSQ